MDETKQTITKLMIAFADAMNSMDDREFNLLIQGKAKLRLVEDKTEPKQKSGENAYLEQAVAEVAQQLNEAESRESAERLIASIRHPRKKQFLLLLSRACGVSAGSKDTIAGIEQKLVEDTVGAKLRSQAIKRVAF